MIRESRRETVRHVKYVRQYVRKPQLRHSKLALTIRANTVQRSCGKELSDFRYQFLVSKTDVRNTKDLTPRTATASFRLLTLD
jgi:hypothetical protein